MERRLCKNCVHRFEAEERMERDSKAMGGNVLNVYRTCIAYVPSLRLFQECLGQIMQHPRPLPLPPPRLSTSPRFILERVWKTWGLLIEKIKSVCRRCLNRVTNGGYRDAVIFGRIPRADLRARSDQIGSIVNHAALTGACYSRWIKIENNASDETITPGGIRAPRTRIRFN